VVARRGSFPTLFPPLNFSSPWDDETGLLLSNHVLSLVPLFGWGVPSPNKKKNNLAVPSNGSPLVFFFSVPFLKNRIKRPRRARCLGELFSAFRRGGWARSFSCPWIQASVLFWVFPTGRGHLANTPVFGSWECHPFFNSELFSRRHFSRSPSPKISPPPTSGVFTRGA